MMSPMTPVYGTAFLTIGVLSFFARQNHKQGWKKQRTSFAQAVHQFYEDFGVAAPDTQPSLPSPLLPSLTNADHFQFSTQLIKMRSALGAGGVAPAAMAVQEEYQMVKR